MSPFRRHARSPFTALAAATLLSLGACSSDTTVRDTNEEDTEGTIEADVSDTEQGTEGGLDLDSGNVPGSPEDDAVDEAEDPAGEYDVDVDEDETEPPGE